MKKDTTVFGFFRNGELVFKGTKAEAAKEFGVRIDLVRKGTKTHIRHNHKIQGYKWIGD